MADARNIAVAYPSGDMVHADFALALSVMCMASAAERITVINPKSSIVAQGRNNAVAEAQKIGAEYLLFLDSDMTFPNHTLKRLMEHGKDIVGAIYPKRLPPHELLGDPLESPPMCDADGLVEMARMPTGCLLIRMAVFDRLKRPYFRFGVDETVGKLVGEDYLFCDMARAAGFRVWADIFLTQEVSHLGQLVCRATPPGG